jgi:DNA-binding response OmpR family regulator
MMRLLLVEDDKELSSSLGRDLEKQGFAVDIADNGIDAEFLGNEHPYDIIVLDLGLPQKPGLEVLASWRKANNAVPVIVLTGRNAWHERIEGFKVGADDYLGKPFHFDELRLRIQALLRRSHDVKTQQLNATGFSLDEERQRIIFDDGNENELTGTEFRLLRYFMLNPDKVLSKSRLTEHVYEQEFDRESNLIEVYVRRLRDKLGDEYIVTRRGQGYVFIAKLQA